MRSAAGYWIGGVTAVAGVVVAIVLLVVQIVSVVGEIGDYPRIRSGEPRELRLEARSYTIYYALADHQIQPPEGIRLAVQGPDGVRIRVRRPGWDETYDFGDGERVALARFTIERAGRYAVRVDDPAGRGVVVGPPVMSRLIRAGLPAGLIGLVLVGAGGGLLIATAVRRHR